jgi:hypothetical protein
MNIPQIQEHIRPLVNILEDGRDNAIHASNLEVQLDMPHGHTQEPTRDLVRDAILNSKIPIGSTPHRGYWLIDSEEELEEAIAQWSARADGIRVRIKALREGWRRRVESRTAGGNWPK